jgi:GNAT superfamily N-acetyltransferase
VKRRLFVDMSGTQPAMKRSRVRGPGFGALLASMNQLDHSNNAFANRLGVPPSTPRDRGDRPCGDHGSKRTMVLAQPLGASEWEMIRTFVRKTDRDDLRLRFGQWLDFHSEPILKRFFDLGGKSSELLCALDDSGDISGILHRVPISPCEAEIGLIVRSDLKRTGIGEMLLRTALARALQQKLRTLRAFVLGENRAMLRLARKIGAVPSKSAGLSVELEFDLSRICAGARTPAAGVAINSSTSTLS